MLRVAPLHGCRGLPDTRWDSLAPHHTPPRAIKATTTIITLITNHTLLLVTGVSPLVCPSNTVPNRELGPYLCCALPLPICLLSAPQPQPRAQLNSTPSLPSSLTSPRQLRAQARPASSAPGHPSTPSASPASVTSPTGSPRPHLPLLHQSQDPPLHLSISSPPHPSTSANNATGTQYLAGNVPAAVGFGGAQLPTLTFPAPSPLAPSSSLVALSIAPTSGWLQLAAPPVAALSALTLSMAWCSCGRSAAFSSALALPVGTLSVGASLLSTQQSGPAVALSSAAITAALTADGCCLTVQGTTPPLSLPPPSQPALLSALHLVLDLSPALLTPAPGATFRPLAHSFLALQSSPCAFPAQLAPAASPLSLPPTTLAAAAIPPAGAFGQQFVSTNLLPSATLPSFTAALADHTALSVSAATATGDKLAFTLGSAATSLLHLSGDLAWQRSPPTATTGANASVSAPITAELRLESRLSPITTILELAGTLALVSDTLHVRFASPANLRQTLAGVSFTTLTVLVPLPVHLTAGERAEGAATWTQAAPPQLRVDTAVLTTVAGAAVRQGLLAPVHTSATAGLFAASEVTAADLTCPSSTQAQSISQSPVGFNTLSSRLAPSLKTSLSLPPPPSQTDPAVEQLCVAVPGALSTPTHAHALHCAAGCVC